MIENAYDEIIKLAGNSIKIKYSKGYYISEETIEEDKVLIKEAKKAAKESDMAIVFLGTPESYDREGFDRTNINLPLNQIKLLKEIRKVQKSVIVVLSNGSPVIISSWYNYADSILEVWLTGQAGGGAIADILFGIENPSGKLSSTFPIQLSDNPTYLDYVDSEDNLQYKEGIFVGYRYYDKKNMKVAFPFGFGLSYTTFSYSDLQLNKDVINEGDKVEVKVKVKNTGKYYGKEIVQLYVKKLISTVQTAEKELRSFAKVSLYPGEEKEIDFILEERDFDYYDVVEKNWRIESGPFQILIGKSSKEICLSKIIYIQSLYIQKIHYTRDTLIEAFLRNAKTKELIEHFLEDSAKLAAEDKESQENFISFLKSNPIQKLLTVTKGSVTEKILNQIIQLANTD